MPAIWSHPSVATIPPSGPTGPGKPSTISVFNGATCNATDTAGCHRAQPKFPVGRAPGAVTIDPMVGTVYTSNGDDTVSIIPVPR